MNVCFDLLVSRDFFAEFSELKEQFVEWGGDAFKQDPSRFVWGNSVFFTERKIPSHIAELLPPVMPVQDMTFLSLDGDAIVAWETAANSADVAIAAVPLRNLLLSMLPKLSQWAVVFDVNCDQIDNVYRLDPGQVIEKIDSNLLWTRDPEGFIGYQIP